MHDFTSTFLPNFETFRQPHQPKTTTTKPQATTLKPTNKPIRPNAPTLDPTLHQSIQQQRRQTKNKMTPNQHRHSSRLGKRNYKHSTTQPQVKKLVSWHSSRHCKATKNQQRFKTLGTTQTKKQGNLGTNLLGRRSEL